MHSKGTTKYLNKKLGKIENKLNIPKLSNKTPKLYEKQTSFNDVLDKHNKKQNARKKKWAEKAAKKAEKKKS